VRILGTCDSIVGLRRRRRERETRERRERDERERRARKERTRERVILLVSLTIVLVSSSMNTREPSPAYAVGKLIMNRVLEFGFVGSRIPPSQGPKAVPYVPLVFPTRIGGPSTDPVKASTKKTPLT